MFSFCCAKMQNVTRPGVAQFKFEPIMDDEYSMNGEYSMSSCRRSHRFVPTDEINGKVWLEGRQ